MLSTYILGEIRSVEITQSYLLATYPYMGITEIISQSEAGLCSDVTFREFHLQNLYGITTRYN